MQALGAASAACRALGGVAFNGIIYKGLFRIGFSTGLQDVEIVLVEGCNCAFRNEGVLFRGWDRSESYQSCCRVGAARYAAAGEGCKAGAARSRRRRLRLLVMVQGHVPTTN